MLAQRNRVRTTLALALTFTLSLAAIGLQAGCGNRNTSSVKPQSYADDGYLGRTNANPHIPGRHMALNYNNDAVLIQQAIRDVPGVRGSSVTFNGADAYVTLKLAPSLGDRQVPTVERQAASVLRFNFPRYNIHVSSMR
ncbi:hypothetical protein H7B90_26440 [Cohnella xylanilytica]|uniref:Sporulation lipoprotein YhcN/YlaJ n=1 Tax=Cohnella xylanilytica TaxID=557555 RepID=A0A841UAI4_9BACL|nr:hypothetical protein [Cohnella xylanilytica]MBB6694940.1 hypothetical protein [Cohnella xylanilytica]